MTSIYIEDIQVDSNHFPPMVHAPTLCMLPNGELLTVWYAGSYEGASDTVLVSARRVPGPGGGWSEPTLLLKLPALPLGNPVLFAEANLVRLFFVILYGSWWTAARLACIESCDGGRTWSSPELLRDEAGLMSRTPPVRLRTGTLLLPVYDEQNWAPLVLRQEAGKRDWQLFGDTTARGRAIQPALAELADGSILMYSRSNQGAIFASWSFNDGRSWTASQPTTLPNPNSSIALVAVPAIPGKTGTGEESLVLVYNPDSQGRERLAVGVSIDRGRTWTPPCLLASGQGEFSYPTALVAPDGTFHVVFSRHRAFITHATFDLAWAAGGDQGAALPEPCHK
ncbi:MAG: exo-alpha-sialidase [Ktedonobacteraceae bacterium]|nr:exo-alpha-sialidase [Ktedonobacteraceae bacterium]